jgi:hypothetical protein
MQLPRDSGRPKLPHRKESKGMQPGGKQTYSHVNRWGIYESRRAAAGRRRRPTRIALAPASRTKATVEALPTLSGKPTCGVSETKLLWIYTANSFRAGTRTSSFRGRRRGLTSKKRSSSGAGLRACTRTCNVCGICADRQSSVMSCFAAPPARSYRFRPGSGLEAGAKSLQTPKVMGNEKKMVAAHLQLLGPPVGVAALALLLAAVLFGKHSGKLERVQALRYGLWITKWNLVLLINKENAAWLAILNSSG